MLFFHSTFSPFLVATAATATLKAITAMPMATYVSERTSSVPMTCAVPMLWVSIEA